MVSLRSRLTCLHEGSTRIIPSIPSFASLPAELRNNIYRQTLHCSKPMVISYNENTKQFHIRAISSANSRACLQALNLFGGLNHYIRKEARSFFFANNSFEIQAKQTLTTDHDYIQVYIDFLNNIGDTGRRSLRQLRLIVTGDSKRHRPTAKVALAFWKLLADCMNLERLDLFLEVDYFYMDQLSAMKRYLSTHGCPVNKPWPRALDTLSQLKNLKRLTLHIVFSSRWRYIDINLDTTESKRKLQLRSPGSVTRIRFQVKRPIDEAAELTDRVKGCLRRQLRRRVAVRTLTTEAWDLYGADVLFLRVKRDSDEMMLSEPKRFKPQERQFNYSNGF